MKDELREAAYERALMVGDRYNEPFVGQNQWFYEGFDAGYEAGKPKWISIQAAPKDGSAILLLSIPYENDMGPSGIYQIPAKAAIGYWDKDGTSWVATDLLGQANVELQKTGVWMSGGGWFQPDEVSHWMPIPPYTEGE